MPKILPQQGSGQEVRQPRGLCGKLLPLLSTPEKITKLGRSKSPNIPLFKGGLSDFPEPTHVIPKEPFG